MATTYLSEETVGEIQVEAALATRNFTKLSRESINPKVAADWSLAAKNAVSVALSCEHILKARKGGR